MDNGSSDGKYRKTRPDTEVGDGHGDMVMRANRSDLDVWFNYGYVTQEAPDKVNPGGL